MEKKEVVQQTALAFDFIQKLYFEVSYLIKEIEGLLAEEDERFIIGRPSGYAITSRNSSGLEPNLVGLWALKKMSVCFIPEEQTKLTGGVTNTVFNENLRIIYLRIILSEKEISEPYICMGVLYEFEDKKRGWPTKFEQLMAHIEYNESKVFADTEFINYADARTSFKGNIFKVNLYDINSSEEIVKLLLTPTLRLYRETKPN